MRVAPEERVITDPEQLEWQDVTSETDLPSGVQWKLLSESKERGIRNRLAWFPPGYVEPRHVHHQIHASFLLQGRWIIEGREVGPGSYMFGPGEIPHGPFESPEGSLVFSSVTGGDSKHVYPVPQAIEEQYGNAKTLVVTPDDVEWKDAAAMLGLPTGVKFKSYHTDEATGRLDGLASFPPGYVEPRHTHGFVHSDVLLEGRWIIEGQEVGLGGFIYGPPGVEHGPFECPDGVVVCASTFGTPEERLHEWDG
jgi:anti-sigma factor ChrR (cupin superfamily)